MAGTKTGGKQTAAKNLAKNPNFYREIGSKGGSAPTKKPKGFAANPQLAREAGNRAGKISKRGHKYIRSDGLYRYYVLHKTGEVVRYELNAASV